MTYLSPSEYESFNVDATTPASWIAAASTLIDAYCRRPTLAASQYEERIRVAPDRNTVRVTYLPLAAVAPATTPLVNVRARYATPRRGEWPWGELATDLSAFGLPGMWTNLDPNAIDYCSETGELTLPVNALGLGFSEIEVTYTAGLSPIPDAVKLACAQIVRNAQSTPALNVRTSRIDTMQLEYFSDTLLDDTVRRLLAPYVTQKVG